MNEIKSGEKELEALSSSARIARSSAQKPNRDDPIHESASRGVDATAPAIADASPEPTARACILGVAAALASFGFLLVDLLNGGSNPVWHELLWVPFGIGAGIAAWVVPFDIPLTKPFRTVLWASALITAVAVLSYGIYNAYANESSKLLHEIAWPAVASGGAVLVLIIAISGSVCPSKLLVKTPIFRELREGCAIAFGWWFMVVLSVFFYFLVDFLNGGNDPLWHELLWLPFLSGSAAAAWVLSISTKPPVQEPASKNSMNTTSWFTSITYVERTIPRQQAKRAEVAAAPGARAVATYLVAKHAIDAPLRFTQQMRTLRFETGREIGAVSLPEATGGRAPVRYSLNPSVPGLRFLDNQRILVGSPERPGSFQVQYSATDRNGKSISQQITVMVAGR